MTDNLPAALRRLASIYAAVCFLGIVLTSLPEKQIEGEKLEEDPLEFSNVTGIPLDNVNLGIGTVLDPNSS